MAELEALIDELHVGVIVCGPDAKIIASNRMAAELLGMAADRHVGATPLGLATDVVREDGSPFHESEDPIATAIRTAIAGAQRRHGRLSPLARGSRHG